MNKLVLICFCCTVFGCVNKTKPDQVDASHEFFPVSSFIEGQIHEVDSLKLPTRKYISDDHNTDSGLISLEEFNSLARDFMEPDINEAATRRFYKETSFADQSVPSVTFTYGTSNKDLSLKRVDVIVSPDPVMDDRVKSVYLEKVYNSGDTAIVKKMFWKTNRFFQVTTSKQLSGSPATFNKMKVAWSATD